MIKKLIKSITIITCVILLFVIDYKVFSHIGQEMKQHRIEQQEEQRQLKMEHDAQLMVEKWRNKNVKSNQ